MIICLFLAYPQHTHTHTHTVLCEQHQTIYIPISHLTFLSRFYLIFFVWNLFLSPLAYLLFYCQSVANASFLKSSTFLCEEKILLQLSPVVYLLRVYLSMAGTMFVPMFPVPAPGKMTGTY